MRPRINRCKGCNGLIYEGQNRYGKKDDKRYCSEDCWIEHRNNKLVQRKTQYYKYKDLRFKKQIQTHYPHKTLPLVLIIDD